MTMEKLEALKMLHDTIQEIHGLIIEAIAHERYAKALPTMALPSFLGSAEAFLDRIDETLKELNSKEALK